MTKYKIVIKVTMPNAKSRVRAMVVAAKTNGVISIAIAGDLKDRLEVVGEGIDITCLVHCLRKKLCHAEVLKVEEVKDKPPEKKKPPEPCACPAPSPCAAYLHTPLVFSCEQAESPAFGCNIM
ncbi:hypothetical protein GQ55_7G176100 [Panicum hallii var. hallii]|uniref:HMA domain-containing protein n=1 Tax=Panicum hallii var. hallii TaxID=1504633 RepID=A0A2T7CW39_9POAL|nr:hypothetical protein GQ55_7G176100 [Panicum hallii var. hallii]PUZ47566.1 hypothetical protein GQ55_7G176100 [Panicum hallii var. hallii]PUZ47567.1 hypothetical protein GQ55_7G176100 [Panicum hallii var. hallii]